MYILTMSIAAHLVTTEGIDPQTSTGKHYMLSNDQVQDPGFESLGCHPVHSYARSWNIHCADTTMCIRTVCLECPDTLGVQFGV